jgi:hypothetical protein
VVDQDQFGTSDVQALNVIDAPVDFRFAADETPNMSDVDEFDSEKLVIRGMKSHKPLKARWVSRS